MKQFLDQKGNLINFGETVHYTERVRKKGYTSFCEIHTTLTPENVEALKMMGAITETEEKVDLEYYNRKLMELLSVNDNTVLLRFQCLFPAQYLSAVITLINDDIDDENNIKDFGFIFNMGTGKFEKIKVDQPSHYVNVFSSEKTKNICSEIIRPFVSSMYK